MAAFGRGLVWATRKLTEKASGQVLQTNAVQMHQQLGIPGSNLPFSIKNPARLTFNFMWFFGSAFSIPFYIVRWHLIKRQEVVYEKVPEIWPAVPLLDEGRMEDDVPSVL